MESISPADIVKKAGGPVALAHKLQITSQAISQWDQVPGKHVLAVSDASGIPPHEIRPDLYRPPAEAAA